MNETFIQLYRDILIYGHIIRSVRECNGSYFFDVYPAPKIVLADKWTTLTPNINNLWPKHPKRVRHYSLTPIGCDCW